MSEEAKMRPRLNYKKLAPEGYARLTAVEHYLNTGTRLDKNLLDMVRLLASLLNGCEFCVAMHKAELKKQHEPDGRIDRLLEWRDSDAYTQRERAAFVWTEAITNIQQGHAQDAPYDMVRAHFSDVETVNLTLTITNINAWNRMAIAFRVQPPAKHPEKREVIDDDGGKITEDNE